jgi:hypothetical protein
VVSLRSGAYAPPAGYAGNGHLLFLQETTLMAQPIDPTRFDLRGDAFPIAEQVGYNVGESFFLFQATACWPIDRPWTAAAGNWHGSIAAGRSWGAWVRPAIIPAWHSRRTERRSQ